MISSVTDKKENEQIKDYKTLVISKDNEISKLNEINISKENEIQRLNKLIEDMKSGSITQEMEENFKKEKEKLLTKINNLELKIYNINDEKNKLSDKLNTNDKNENNEDNNKENNETNKIDNEELLKMKEGTEEKNKELKDGKENENLNLNQKNSPNSNNEDLYKQIKELKRTIEDYKTGKIIPENTKNDIDLIKNEKLSDIEELRKKFELVNTKNKSYESKIKYLNDNITKNSKNKKDLETIILKQEDKINELNTLIKRKDNKIHSKEASINKNEVYSLQLMNIIKEQKLQIKNIKKQKIEEENSQIAELKRQINNLENTIELKDNTIENMKKTHKNLQDKYIKLCFNIKKQEQDNLLNQAKMLKKQKLARDALMAHNKYLSKSIISNNLPQNTEESNAMSEIDYPNIRTNPNINSVSIEKEKKEIISKTRNDVVLPAISTNNSVKIEDNININSKDSLVEGEWNKLDDINEEMKKIIEEN